MDLIGAERVILCLAVGHQLSGVGWDTSLEVVAAFRGRGGAPATCGANQKIVRTATRRTARRVRGLLRGVAFCGA